MKQFIFLVFIGAALISCKKKYHVVGRALNPITGQGLANLKVEFIKTNTEFPGGYDEVASTWTDANGNYEIEYKGRAERVKLDGSGEYYGLGTLYNGSYEQAVILEHKKTQEIDWHLVPYGNLIIHLKNENCLGPNDTLRLFLDGSTIGFDDVQIGLLTELYGCIDIVDQPIKFPMGERYYHWEIIRSGITTVVYDTIFVEPNQTTTFEIFY